MVKLLSTGRVRNIGVANFSPHQIHELIRKSYVKPAVHQMELHPYLQQAEWVDFHQKHGIHVTAYSPLGNMNPIYRKSSKRDKSAHPPLLLENKVMKKIADERGCTPAQVALAWGISRETSVIPKSSHPEYIRENSGSLECRLHKKDNGKIKKLGRKFLKRFNNPSERWGVDLFEGLDDA
jgi:alcohol dehydrogenase (NADP+)